MVVLDDGSGRPEPWSFERMEWEKTTAEFLGGDCSIWMFPKIGGFPPNGW